MQHPDTDLLNTWLDGELSAAEAAALETHLSGCPACAARASEQRMLQATADSLLAELDAPVPGFASGAAHATTTAQPSGHGRPLVLLPYHDMVRWRRSGWRRGIGIAATLFVAAGAGWMALRPDASGGRAATEILSNAPSSGASTPLPAAPAESVATPAFANTTAGSPAATIESAAPRVAESSVPQPSFADAQVTPVAPRRESPPAPVPAALKTGISAMEPQRIAELKARRDREPLAVELDAQISTRIGLDEARRQLGGNLHVIDGLRAELVGLVPGRLVPGADSSRPVVRVVYLDGQGQSFFLDQQRVATDARGRQAAPGSWLDGDVQLHLHGALSEDSLAGLARRIR